MAQPPAPYGYVNNLGKLTPAPPPPPPPQTTTIGDGIVKTVTTTAPNKLGLVNSSVSYTVGGQELTRDLALDLISRGQTVPMEALEKVGIGSDDGFTHSFRFAHIRSPAYQAMVDNFDPNYGTAGVRNVAAAVAQQIGVDPEQFDKVVGAEFARMLRNNEYHIADQSSINKLADVVFNEAKRITGQEIPQEVKQQVYNYTGQVRSLWDVPHPETSGFFKQLGSSFASSVLNLGGSLLKPIGLEKYAAPIIGAGITAASGGTLGTVGAAIAGGATAGALPGIAAGDYSSAVQGALLGGATNVLGTAINPAINSVVNSAVSGTGATGVVADILSGGLSEATSNTIGAVLTGGDISNSIVQGLISGGSGGAANSIVNNVFNDPTRIDGTIEVETPEVVSGGAGVDRPNLTGDLGLNINQLISNTNISPIGINTGNFTPNPIDPLNPNFNNLGGTFGSEPGLNPVSTPNLTSGGGTGITIPLINADGQQVGFQGSGGSVTNNFNTPLGDPNSFVNNPTITGQPLVSGGTVTPVPDFNSSLTDLANNNVGTGLTGNTGNNVQPVPVQNVAQTGTERFLSNQLRQYLTGLFTQTGNTLVNGGGGSNPLVQNPASGNNTGANMPDYSGLIGNILGQNTQIQRLEDTGTQIAGNFNQAAADVNKPFTPYNISTAAGNTNVNGQNITQTLSQPQQQLADVAGQAAGMFGDVNIPGVENIRNTALQGSQNLLQQAQGFNPQQAAQQEFDALQQLYAPQRERDRMALENRLRMQGRLGASDNPALRQLEESFRQQDLQGSIQSRNLGFERQKQLQDLSQGMFTQGSQAAQLPTQIQSQRAQIGVQGAQASQLPFQTATQQQQGANQLAATQASQGTALANVIANLRSKGLETQAGLMSQAGALRNARDVAAIQGVLGGASGGGAINGVANGVASGVSGAVNNAIGSGVNALAGLVGSGVSSIGNRLAGLFTNAYVNPANSGLSTEQLNAMTDDQFLDFIMNDAGD